MLEQSAVDRLADRPLPEASETPSKPKPSREMVVASAALLGLAVLLAGSMFELARRGVAAERQAAARDYAAFGEALKKAEARVIELERAAERRAEQGERLQASLHDTLRLNQEALSALLRGLRDFEAARVRLQFHEAELETARQTAGQRQQELSSRLSEVDRRLESLRKATVHVLWSAQKGLDEGQDGLTPGQKAELHDALNALGAPAQAEERIVPSPARVPEEPVLVR